MQRTEETINLKFTWFFSFHGTPFWNQYKTEWHHARQNRSRESFFLIKDLKNELLQRIYRTTSIKVNTFIDFDSP